MGTCMSPPQRQAQKSIPPKSISLPVPTPTIVTNILDSDNNSIPHKNLFKTFSDWDEHATKPATNPLLLN